MLRNDHAVQKECHGSQFDDAHCRLGNGQAVGQVFQRRLLAKNLSLPDVLVTGSPLMIDSSTPHARRMEMFTFCRTGYKGEGEDRRELIEGTLQRSKIQLIIHSSSHSA